jgi:hypothetical protein
LPNIDKAPDSTLPERKDGMWRPQLELTKQRDCWDSREFAHERRHARCVLAGTAHGNENGIHLLRLQVVDYIVDVLPM